MHMLLMFAFLLWIAPAAAQTGPDYAIENVRPAQLSANGSAVELVFDVNNLGSAASSPATVRAINEDTSEVVAIERLDSLDADQRVTIRLIIPSRLLSPDREQVIQVSVSVDQTEAQSEDVSNNTANITIPPLEVLQQAPSTLPTPQSGTETPTGTPMPEPDGLETLLASLGFEPDNLVHVVAAVAISIVLLVMLVLLIVLLRLLFRRQNRFELHLPPYANIPPMAPSTTAGRRQGWQIHAQNDLPPPYPANEGATHIRKLLTGIDNIKLANWQISGLRISQYDQYGRVARSEVIGTPGLCRRLSKAADRAPSLTEEQISRRVRPVARALASQFRRKINPRSAMLPIALDIAFQGVHGEVRIRFELFYLEQGRWRLVDTWEPEMTVSGKAIHENFTYTLHGQRQGEPLKLFVRRLQDDLSVTLTDMLRHEPADTGRSEAIQTVEE